MNLEKHIWTIEKRDGLEATIAIGFQNKKYFISCLVLLCFNLNISDLGFTKFTIIVLIRAGQGGLGIKILNLFPPRPGVRGQNIAPSPPPPTLRSGVGWGGAKLPSLLNTIRFQLFLVGFECFNLKKKKKNHPFQEIFIEN